MVGHGSLRVANNLVAWARPGLLLGLCQVLSACAGKQAEAPVWQVQPTIYGDVRLAAEAGVTVSRCTVWIVKDGDTVSRTRTGRDGRYKLTGLPAGPFDVRANRGSDFLEYSYRARMGTPLDLKSFTKPDRALDIVLEGHPAAITGLVVEERTGAAIDSARVWTYPQTVEAWTGVDGRFRIESTLFEPAIPYVAKVLASRHYDATSASFIVPPRGELDVGRIDLRARTPDEPTEQGTPDRKPKDPGDVAPVP